MAHEGKYFMDYNDSTNTIYAAFYADKQNEEMNFQPFGGHEVL